jgi:pyruvate kinase
MARIVEAAEAGGVGRIPPLERWARSKQEAVSAAAVRTASAVGATALVALTQTGRTARCLARHRSPIPLVALTPNPAVPRQLALTWDVEPHLVAVADREAEELAQVDAVLHERGHAVGDRVVVVSGDTGRPGSTHTMRVHELRG